MSTSTKEIIVSKLNELSKSNWKAGFDTSVLSEICRAIGETPPKGNLWSYMCCGYKEKVVAGYFDGDNSIMELYNEVDKNSKDGGFEMPQWGTYGT